VEDARKHLEEDRGKLKAARAEAATAAKNVRQAQSFLNSAKDSAEHAKLEKDFETKKDALEAKNRTVEELSGKVATDEQTLRSAERRQRAAAVAAKQQAQSALPGNSAAQSSNGISVGRPKIFDNRTLTIMLESLSQTLAGVQFLDQKPVATAIGNLSGFSSKDTTSNLTVSTLPTPTLSNQTITNTGNADKNGAILPNNGISNTSQVTNGSNTASVVPAAPTLDAVQALAGFTPNFGPNGSDLLNDQINLQYQIFNLRLLLERALSDRTLHTGAPRLQAVVGFNVSINPPQTAEDSVAIVEVTMTREGDADPQDDLSLVSVMPQEKTYNAAALSSKSQSFGGSAVVKMIEVGYSQRRKSQVFYLYRDTDTLSFEDMTRESKNQIVFGWAFRPVLGRRSVSPGLKQMFAIVSLPQSDRGKAAANFTAHVKTYWKKYDANTLTAFNEKDAARRGRFLYGASLGLAKPQIWEKRYLNNAEYPGIEVKTTSGYEEELTPKITSARWRPVGNKSALITVEGENFFSGTQIAIGDKNIASAADGLILKSNNTFDVLTSIDALSNGPGMLLGRYGPAVPLIDTSTPPPSNGIAIKQVDIGPALSGSRSLSILLVPKQNPPDKLLLDMLPKDPIGPRKTDATQQPTLTLPSNPIITVNGKFIPGPYTIYQDDRGVMVTTQFDDSVLSNGGAAVKISWPFLTETWTATKFRYDPALAITVSRSGDKSVIVATNDPLGFNLTDLGSTGGPGFCWHLGSDAILMPQTCDRDSDKAKGVPLSTHAFSYTFETDIPDKIVLVTPNGATMIVDVPKADAATAGSTSPKPIALNQYDRVWIDIPAAKGKDFTTSPVAKVEANQLTLPFQTPNFKTGDKPVTTLHVEVTEAITDKPGVVDITVQDANNVVLGTAKIQITCVDCKTTTGAKQ
jgi:hypothetical protein